MKKLLTNQQGYNLMVVILVSTIFLVVGLSILTMSLQGSIRTSIRETDIKATAQARQIMDEIIAELQQNVSINQLDSSISSEYRLDLKKVDGNLVPISFDPTLKKIIKDKIYGKFDENHLNAVQNLDITELTTKPPYNIRLTDAFTRVYKVTLIVKNQKGKSEALIKRKLERTVILSPTPSFLQYAVGAFDISDNSGLILRGSPTIQGNVFANKLTIQRNARYYERNNSSTFKEINTPLPSVLGDIYTTNTKLLDQMVPENFYGKKVPSLKNHSVFVDMNLNQTRLERTSQLIDKQFDEKSTTLNPSLDRISNYLTTQFKNLKFKSVKDLLGSLKVPLPGLSSAISNLGSIVTANSDLLINDSAIEINNISPVSLKSLQVKGNLTLNSKDPLTITDKLFVDGNIIINNYNTLNIGKIITTGSIKITNAQGILTIKDQILTKQDLSIDAFQPVNILSESIVGGNLNLNPSNTTISVLNNMIVNNNFNITGNSDKNTVENDNTIFNSVIYVGGESSITNVNIKGADNNTKQLVLLSENNLELFRLNEFNNLDNPKEQLDASGRLKDISEVSNITPLQGYFYTDKNAELYGVGSFFYINGGLFAHNTLTINAIRGSVQSEDTLTKFSNTPTTQPQEQNQKYSRFNVKYDKSVLLNRIDALPIVNSLQVIPDDTTIK